MTRVNPLGALLVAAATITLTPVLAQTAGPTAWQNDLTPIGPKDWNRECAAHLLERAGFGGTPAEIDALAKMTPAQAIARLVRYEGTDVSHMPAFDESGIRDPGLEPFPPSRPAVTEMAKKIGEALGMLTFLDAGVNVKGAPNENFAREIMEMFTMGVGHYSEKDVREAARAFTGWNYVDLKFVVNKDKHDDGEKTFLGKTGNFDGVDIIDIIMQQPATADYIAGKLYRFFVRDNPSPELQKKLGAVFRDNHYEIAPLLETIFLSRDFYLSLI